MDEKSKAEIEIIEAADNWARIVLREDRLLDSVEQKLLETILWYRKITRTFDLPPGEIPKYPPVPKDFLSQDTQRYSDVPTVPSPARGIKAVDIDKLELDEEDLWTGKQKPE